MNKSNYDEFTLITRIDFLLSYADDVYRKYIASGKKFIFASILYAVNDEVKRAIFENIEIIAREKHCYAKDLLIHIDVWQKVWLEEFELQNPSCDSEFSFFYSETFPVSSVKKLLGSSVADG
jgi:hypothetical protein